MIHPQLVPHATMLVYVFTDAEIAPSELDTLLRGAVEPTSTASRSTAIPPPTTRCYCWLRARAGRMSTHITRHSGRPLEDVCTSLAKQIVDDGEGVTHVVELQIEGAASDRDALKVAKAIAHSPLVKTAWAGCDPNWGRLMAAAGYSGAEIDPERIAIWLGDQQICRERWTSGGFRRAAGACLPEEPLISRFGWRWEWAPASAGSGRQI